MSANPLDHLEIQAVQQRNQVHETIGELKDKVAETRARLDPVANARQHFLGLSLVVGAAGFVAGYLFAGLFDHR